MATKKRRRVAKKRLPAKKGRKSPKRKAVRGAKKKKSRRTAVLDMAFAGPNRTLTLKVEANVRRATATVDGTEFPINPSGAGVWVGTHDRPLGDPFTVQFTLKGLVGVAAKFTTTLNGKDKVENDSMHGQEDNFRYTYALSAFGL